MAVSTSISNGRPERKDVTLRVEELKKQQIEKDRQAAIQRGKSQLATATR